VARRDFVMSALAAGFNANDLPSCRKEAAKGGWKRFRDGSRGNGVA